MHRSKVNPTALNKGKIQRTKTSQPVKVRTFGKNCGWKRWWTPQYRYQG